MGVVTKILCGNEIYLKEIIALGVREMHDSRISKKIKALDPTIQTVYIKPPAKRSIEKKHYADVSFNTEIDTIKMLSAEAQSKNKPIKSSL
jgi:predicted amino acid racemase